MSLPPGDVLLHGGDISDLGRRKEIQAFARWLAEQPFRHKVLIAGNHDWLFQRDNAQARALLREGCPDAVYLQDSGTEVDGLRIWGSPWQPEFCNWAFNLARREDLASRWKLIPDDTDILITHGPPREILDRTTAGESAGCDALRDEIASRLRPRLHLFGHIHEAYGRLERDGVTYLNASVCTLGYVPRNAPLVVDLP